MVRFFVFGISNKDNRRPKRCRRLPHKNALKEVIGHGKEGGVTDLGKLQPTSTTGPLPRDTQSKQL